MVQGLVQISFDLQITVHIRLSQGDRGACHKIAQRNRFIEFYRKGRFALADLILLSSHFHKERLLVKFLQKRDQSMFYYHFFIIPFILCRHSCKDFAGLYSKH